MYLNHLTCKILYSNPTYDRVERIDSDVLPQTDT